MHAQTADKKKPPEGGFVKSPKGRRWNLLKETYLAGFASILVNCDSSWDEFSALPGKSGIPHSGEFAVFFAKKSQFLTGTAHLEPSSRPNRPGHPEITASAR